MGWLGVNSERERCHSQDHHSPLGWSLLPQRRAASKPTTISYKKKSENDILKARFMATRAYKLFK